MTRVPTDRSSHTKVHGTCCEEFVIMVGAPTPFTYCPVCGQWNEWNVIDGEPVVMSALPRPRFSGPLGEQIELPQGMAESLKRFEEGLRLAGFIGEREHLRQSLKRFNSFRVEELKPADPSILVVAHSETPKKRRGRPPADKPVQGESVQKLNVHGQPRKHEWWNGIDDLDNLDEHGRSPRHPHYGDTRETPPGLED